MRRKQPRTHALLAVLLGVLFCSGIFLFWQITRPGEYRQTIVIVGNPVHIFSFTAAKNQVSVLDIPEDVTVPAIQGYGRYSVGSLFTLDHINHRSGVLFTDRLSDALGVPISGYAQIGRSADGAGSVELVRHIFSWSSIPGMLTGRIKSSVPFGTWVSLVIAAQTLSGDAVTVVHASGAFVPATQADGSVVRALDPSRFDYFAGTAFLDNGIRSEGVSVAVYNTTQVASVGQHAARVMSKVGMPLVFVGNETPERARCIVSGTKEALDSKTAAFIRDYFRCAVTVSPTTENNAAANLVVLLGKMYASRFVSP